MSIVKVTSLLNREFWTAFEERDCILDIVDKVYLEVIDPGAVHGEVERVVFEDYYPKDTDSNGECRWGWNQDWREEEWYTNFSGYGGSFDSRNYERALVEGEWFGVVQTPSRYFVHTETTWPNPKNPGHNDQKVMQETTWNDVHGYRMEDIVARLKYQLESGLTVYLKAVSGQRTETFVIVA